MQRRHKKREGKVERDIARVFYMRLSPVRLKIQSTPRPRVIPTTSLQSSIKPHVIMAVHANLSTPQVLGGGNQTVTYED